MAANVNNYIAAANAAVSKNVRIRKALADNKPNYANLANASVNQAARNRANVAANNASTAETAIRGKTLVEGQQIKADTEKDIRGIDKKARMTGMLAGGAALLGIGAIEMNKEEEPDARLELLQQQNDYWRNRYEQAGKDVDEAGARYDALTEQMNKGGKSGNSSSSSNTDSGGSSSGSSSGTKPISSYQASGKKGKYTVGDMTQLAIDAGFSPENARVMGAIGMAESGGQAGIDTVQSGLDKTKSNEYSIGLFQVNAQAHGDKLAKLGYSEDDLRDPRKAAQVAKMVYDEVGSFKPWSVYKSGAYNQYLQD